ncbi:endonuclease III domain-containing protein [Aggregatibacter actinomycetemcomitans]|uniref:endonuclease III domain-containing protein n=1 Tax=Aggregatibacter actinomycetemcomitans TaxID=714 RepID=UPI001F122224|nr:endonuclease III domain-containing protein [Aggregatibacter actinomycetemcomitans]
MPRENILKNDRTLNREMLNKIEQTLQNLCRHYGEQNWWNNENRIADWVSMILIQQTTEKNAVNALQQLEDILTLEQLLITPVEELQERIRPAGFYKQKSAYIKHQMLWFAEQGGDLNTFSAIPTETLRKNLLALKGVGQETADAMLLYLFDRKVFIADQYALRLFNRLRLSQSQTYTDLRIECMPLMERISLKTAQEWHAVIDEHGKRFRKNPQMDESWILAP